MSRGPVRRSLAGRRVVAGVVAIIAVNALLIAWGLREGAAELAGAAPETLYAVGNIGDGDASARVGAALARHNIGALLTLGDHTPVPSTPGRFGSDYHPAFAALAEVTRPAPGDVEYASADAVPYFEYFEETSSRFPDRPFYAFTVAGWRVYSLNSEVGGHDPGGALYEWLRADLLERPRDCVLAYWHGDPGAVDQATAPTMLRVWQLLAAHGAEIVLTAHERNYQRLEPRDGVTAFVVGTGGQELEPVRRDNASLAFATSESHGFLELELRAGAARFAFRTDRDEVLDSGEVSCADPIAGLDTVRPEPPGDLAARRAEAEIRLAWSTGADDRGVAGYAVFRGVEQIGFTTQTSFSEPVAGEQAVLYTVRTVDAAGNQSTPSAPAPSAPDTPGFTGFVWAPVGGNPPDPTADKPQSKLWWNDGAWWGVLWAGEPVERPGYYLMRFDVDLQAWINTGVAADERDRSHADVLWDDTAGRLYVASTIEAGAIKLYRYTYLDAAYVLDAGFPVRLSEDGSESISIAKDSRGRLWATATRAVGGGLCREGEACHVQVAHTTGRDFRWTEFFSLRDAAAVVSADDISAIVSFGGDRVGIAWSNQLLDRFYFASHVDGDPDTDWQVEPLSVAPPTADDHLNVKADVEGRVFLVLKTSLNDPADAPADAPLVAALRRDPDGSWSAGVVWTVSDDVTRPQIAVSDGSIFVVGARAAEGSVYLKRSAGDALAFPAGRGELLIAAGQMNNPTTTKQQVTAETGLLILAGDEQSRTYWHSLVPLGEGR